MNIREIAAQIDPTEAQLAVAKIMHSLGSVYDWSADQLEYIAMALPAAPDGVADYTDQDDAALAFWQGVDF
ncbi:hypothetical protein HOT75_gp139 [Gordonia phage Daredevil]|uniref:Uncharacterized protein n=1 Tax=Gordonia phage Daredevil TaxID=2283286 RepID=A0A345MIZ4_9CAUD|nr:hypothetical protein HOT75_gp139 [Gordonia phage Daredevil]AXH70525.1 hypothetical protein SEA_DAREDEVIL_139 [Gordonia phage Daredevil]